MMAGCEAEFFLFEIPRTARPARRRTTRAPISISRRSTKARNPAGDRRASGGDGVRGRGRASRGGAGPARNRLPLRGRLTTADNLATFRFIVRDVARRLGFLASFMPKPIQGQNGSGMHTHQSLSRVPRTTHSTPPTPSTSSPTSRSRISRGCCITRAAFAPSPILSSTASSGWCPATRRR